MKTPIFPKQQLNSPNPSEAKQKQEEDQINQSDSKPSSEPSKEDLKRYKAMEQNARNNPTTIVAPNIIEKIEENYQKKRAEFIKNPIAIRAFTNINNKDKDNPR